jgi:putative ABC transport system permease protein
METVVNDIKLAFRALRRSPAFALTAIVALGLGIGANTAIFSVVNAVLLKPLPYPEPDRIVQLLGVTPQGNFQGFSVPGYNILREQTPVLEDVAAYDTGGPGVNIGGGDRPEQAKGIHVSHEFFRLFGVPIPIGRAFNTDEDRPGGAKVVVISNGLWHRRFGADPNIAGKTILLGAEPYTILGVIGPGFTFTASPDLLLPFQADPNSTQQVVYFSAAARLRPGVSVAMANAALDLASQEFKRKFPGVMGPKVTFGVEPVQETLVHDSRKTLLILLGAVGFVLLIACANVANLQLARATVRAREIAIRAAVGASRWRLMRQLLIESVALSVSGGMLGLIIGVAGVRALIRLNPGDIPRIGIDGAGITVDWRVLAFTLVVSLLTGVLFGLLPGLQISRADLHAVLKESQARSGASVRQNKSRSVLVVVELALAIVLLAGAGLLIRTFSALRSVAPGFDASGVLTMETSLTGARYDRTAAIAEFTRQAEEKIEAIPGVEAAAATSYLPLEGGLGLGFTIEGRPQGDSQSSGGAGWAYVTYRFFDVFRIALISGRKFTDRDTAAAPGVVIINSAFAKKYWPGANPVGQRIRIGGAGMFAEPPREIVGVVADARDAGLNLDPGPEMFVPVPQVKDAVMASNNRFMPLSWVVRSSVAPFSMSMPVTQAFSQLADMPVAHLRTMKEVVVHSTASNQFNTVLLSIFALVAILLASLGLYGLMAYSVEQRRMEFGIRLALGATRPALRNLVLAHALKLALAGIVIGLGAALGLTRLMKTMLYGVQADDAAVFVCVAVLLGVVALLATYLPMRRAIGIDPAIALRYE